MVLYSSLEFTDLDFLISSKFYQKELQQWPYKEFWLTEAFLHKGGQYFSKITGVVVFLILLRSFSQKSALFSCRKPLAFLFVASVTGPIIIAILKNTTHIYCPWDLAMFGGEKPYIRLFDFISADQEVGRCFPAGHAGGGFTFISLYFFLMAIKPQYKQYGLAFGLILGLVYGIAQQMRGAHFLSHDLCALAICWLSSLTLFLLFFRKNLHWQ